MFYSRYWEQKAAFQPNKTGFRSRELSKFGPQDDDLVVVGHTRDRIQTKNSLVPL